jgi:uncharacterized metal-binding protein
MSEKVVVIPCSGIGKTYGSVTREAAYVLAEELRPGATEIVPLALMVLGDEEAHAAVRNCPVIALDGCKLACAAKNIALAGATAAGELNALDVFRRHRDLKPAGISELNDAGLALARAMAQEAAAICERVAEPAGWGRRSDEEASHA